MFLVLILLLAAGVFVVLAANQEQGKQEDGVKPLTDKEWREFQENSDEPCTSLAYKGTLGNFWNDD